MGSALAASLAVAVIVVHVAYLVFQMCGALLALRDPRWLVAHLAAVTWGVMIVVMSWRCPLTTLEKWLWLQAGEVPYRESFLDRYAFGRIFPEGSQPVVYGLHLAVIAGTYIVLVRRWARAPKVAAGAR